MCNLQFYVSGKRPMSPSGISQPVGNGDSTSFGTELDPTMIARVMGPSWGPPGSCRPQMGPVLAPWTLLFGKSLCQHQSRMWWAVPCRFTTGLNPNPTPTQPYTTPPPPHLHPKWKGSRFFWSDACPMQYHFFSERMKFRLITQVNRNMLLNCRKYSQIFTGRWSKIKGAGPHISSLF